MGLSGKIDLDPHGADSYLPKPTIPGLPVANYWDENAKNPDYRPDNSTGVDELGREWVKVEGKIVYLQDVAKPSNSSANVKPASKNTNDNSEMSKISGPSYGPAAGALSSQAHARMRHILRSQAEAPQVSEPSWKKPPQVLTEDQRQRLVQLFGADASVVADVCESYNDDYDLTYEALTAMYGPAKVLSVPEQEMTVSKRTADVDSVYARALMTPRRDSRVDDAYILTNATPNGILHHLSFTDIRPDCLQWRDMQRAMRVPRLLEMLLWPVIYGDTPRPFSEADKEITGGQKTIAVDYDLLVHSVTAQQLREALSLASTKISSSARNNEYQSGNYHGYKPNNEGARYKSLRQKVHRWLFVKEFYDRNANCKILENGCIELHGLAPQDAEVTAVFFVEFFQARLDARRGIPNDYTGIATLRKEVSPIRRLKFIVGKGIHNYNGYSEVKDAVCAGLDSMNNKHRAYINRQLKCTPGEMNPQNGRINDGVVLVDLP